MYQLEEHYPLAECHKAYDKYLSNSLDFCHLKGWVILTSFSLFRTKTDKASGFRHFTFNEFIDSCKIDYKIREKYFDNGKRKKQTSISSS